MRNSIKYEWSIETVDESGNIVDSVFYDNLQFQQLSACERLCLVRSEGNEIDGVVDRLWAYVVDEKLPEFFEDENESLTSTRVPKIFSKIVGKSFSDNRK